MTIYAYKTNPNLLTEDIIVLFSIPIFDTIRLIFIRLVNKKSPFSGDLNHLHHKIYRVFSNQKLSYFFYILVIILPTLISINLNEPIYKFYVIILTGLLYIALIYALNFKLKRQL